MRGTTVLALALGALAACTQASAGATRSTALTVIYRADGSATFAPPTKWTLRCNPAGGTLPRPRVACRRLAVGGQKLFTPVPQNAVCTMIYGGPQVALVVGVVSGTRIWTRFSRENGCQIARWNRVSPWLLPGAA